MRMPSSSILKVIGLQEITDISLNKIQLSN